MTSRVALVVPVIDEGEKFVRQMERTRACCPDVELVIADGGSTDGSTDHQKMADVGVDVVLTKISDGRLSTQLRMAFDYCLRRGFDHVITMDGNGKDDPHGVQAIRKSLDSGVDFVQGSRFVRGGEAENTPLSRLLAIRLIHAPVTSIAARRWYTDTTNGFRGYSRGLLADPGVAVFREVFVRYELLAYLPIRAARLGMGTMEAPVARRYPPDGLVPTKIKGMRGNMDLLNTLWMAARGGFDPTEADTTIASRMVFEPFG